MTDLPSWYPDPGEAKPAPMPLLRVQAFLNTVDVEDDIDRLDDPGAARGWLIDAGLLGPQHSVTAAELGLAREVRDGLRRLLESAGDGGGHAVDLDRGRDAVDLDRGRDAVDLDRGRHVVDLDRGRRAVDLDALRTLAAGHTARLTVDDGGVFRLEGAGDGTLGGGLFEILLMVRAAQEDGSWSRLKMCANPDCLWVFYDRSRNQHGNWCDMAACGNRLKNRQLRARRR